MKTIVTYKVDNQTFVRRLILVAHSKNNITPEMRESFRKKAVKRCVDRSTLTTKGGDKTGCALLIFDFYCVEHLKFPQRILHHFSVIKTAILDYIGINTSIVIITI